MSIGDTVSELLKTYGDNKLAIALGGAMAGALLMKLIPSLWRLLCHFITFVGSLIGGRFAYRAFEGRYLNWLVIEQRELKLTGIVSSEEAKKPNLEQVFVSLRVGNRRTVEPIAETSELEPTTWSVVRTWNDLRELFRLHRQTTDQDVPFKELAKAQKMFRTKLNTQKSSQTADEFDPSKIEEEAVRSWMAPHMGPQFLDTLADFQLRRILRDHTRIAIPGVPGAGKTTLLQYTALTFARERAADRKLRQRGLLKARVGVAQWRLLIVIRLSSVASLLVGDGNGEKTRSILDVIPRTLPPDLQNDPVAADYLARHLERGNCLVLLDGLDEVPTETEFAAVVRAIESLAVRYAHNQFLVTSRIAGWRSGIAADFQVFYVQDLTERQINRFIDIWYVAVERNAVIGPLEKEGSAERAARERRSKQRASDLKRTLSENMGIRRLVVNPMLLSIVALVHRSLVTLPKERSKLYAQCSKILLEQWDISRGVRVDDTNLKLEQKEAIMRRVAFAYHTGEIGDPGGGREAPVAKVQNVIGSILPSLGKQPQEADHLLKRLLERSGILTERQRGILAFSHHTFQEYFAAQHLAAGETIQNRNFLLRPENLLSDWWHEVILLYAGLLSDTSDFLRALYEPTLDDLCQQRLRLAGMCLGEAVGISDTAIRVKVAHGLRCVRTRGDFRPSDMGLPTEEVDYLVLWAKGQHWFSSAAVASVKARNGSGAKSILIENISVALKDRQSIISRAAVECVPCLQEAANLNDLVEGLIGQVSAQDPENRRSAIKSLALIASSKSELRAQQVVIDALDDAENSVREAAAAALQAMSKVLSSAVAATSVERLLTNTERTSRFYAASLFPVFAERIIRDRPDALLPLLTDPHVCATAARGLRELDNLELARPSIRTLCDRIAKGDIGDEKLAIVVMAIGELPKSLVTNQVFDQLVHLLVHQEGEIRFAAEITLARLGVTFTEDIIKRLCPLLHYADKAAARALAVIAEMQDDTADSGAIDTLVTLTTRKQHGIKAAAIYAMGIARHSLVSDAVRLRLVSLAHHKSAEVRAAALNSLARLSKDSPSAEVIQTISSALDDRVKLVRFASLVALAEIPFHNLESAIVEKVFSVFTDSLTKNALLWRALVDVTPGFRFRIARSLSPIAVLHFGIVKIGTRLRSERLFEQLMGVYSTHSFLLDLEFNVVKGDLLALARATFGRVSVGDVTRSDFAAKVFWTVREMRMGRAGGSALGIGVPWEFMLRTRMRLDWEEEPIEASEGTNLFKALANWLPTQQLVGQVSQLLTHPEVHMQELALRVLCAGKGLVALGIAREATLHALGHTSPSIRMAALSAVQALEPQALHSAYSWCGAETTD